MRKLNVAASIGSLLASCLSILTWFNVTPEMVGESVYAIISAAVPFVTLVGGGFFGWGVASIRCRRQVDRSAEEARMAEDSARSLERFKADAEPKLERLAEIENEYDLRRFSKIQLRYMLLCLCEESIGNVGIEKEWGGSGCRLPGRCRGFLQNVGGRRSAQRRLLARSRVASVRFGERSRGEVHGRRRRRACRTVYAVMPFDYGLQ